MVPTIGIREQNAVASPSNNADGTRRNAQRKSGQQTLGKSDRQNAVLARDHAIADFGEQALPGRGSGGRTDVTFWIAALPSRNRKNRIRKVRMACAGEAGESSQQVCAPPPAILC